MRIHVLGQGYLQPEVAAHATYNQDVWTVAVRHCPLSDLHQHCKDGLLHALAVLLHCPLCMLLQGVQSRKVV